MKARVVSSLALPAALATAGLLNGAEAAYAAAVASDSLPTTAAYGHPEQAMGGVTVTSGYEHPCTPMGNMTITDYIHCCTPIGNMTITGYHHHCCAPVANLTFCDYGHHGHLWPFEG
ncbi:hypothetical protein ABZ915_37515 [Streptomyces sp. NPDC046915]|uniref:hypothetical protein n=1 Tax=Streptomyces sp. NPDC046915 TaxID=3155257 RepID=UPI0033DA726F